jgi:hypothetical protein
MLEMQGDVENVTETANWALTSITVMKREDWHRLPKMGAFGNEGIMQLMHDVDPDYSLKLVLDRATGVGVKA